MNFLAQQQEVAAQLGLDQTVAAQATLVKRWLNTSQRMILQAYDWPFLVASDPLIIQTVPDYSTGTVTVAASSNSLTFSSAITDSVQGRYIQFETSNDWFLITSHSGGNATATITPNSIDAVTSGTFTIRKFNYSTSALVDRIIQIKQAITPYQLIEVSKTNFDEIRPNPDETSTPRAYMINGLDANQYPQFILYPTPDAVINLSIYYYSQVVDLSADTDVSIIPEKWRTSVMIEGAKAQGLDFLDDTRAVSSFNKFTGMIEAMKQNVKISTKRQYLMRAPDDYPYQRVVPFPDNYGYPYGR